MVRSVTQVHSQQRAGEHRRDRGRAERALVGGTLRRLQTSIKAGVKTLQLKKKKKDLIILKAPSTLHPSIRLLGSRFISRSSAVVLVSVVMWQVSPHAVSNRSNSRLSTCSSSVAKSVAGALTNSH